MRKLIHFILPIVVIILQISYVQDTHSKRITFQVDMSKVDSPERVGIRGNTPPLSWDKTYYLKDENKNHIYENTLEFDVAQNTIQFKFVNNNDSFELECTNNRNVTLEYKPQVIEYSAVFDQSDGYQKNYD